MKNTETIGQDTVKDQKDHKFHWKLINRVLIFWSFAVLMLIGIIYFIMTYDFVLTPHP